MNAPANSSRFHLPSLLALALVAMVAPSHAALLLYDGMESYTVGAGMNGLNGGTAAGGATWSAYNTSSSGQTVAATSLSYTGGSVTINGGTKAYFSNSASTTFQLNRSYTIPTVADGNSVYVSYLVRSTNGFSGDDAFTQVGIYNSLNWGTVTYLNGSTTDVGVRAGSGSNVSGSTIESLQDGVTYFVVQQYTVSGANTVMSTWINPTSLTLGTPTATSTGVTSTASFTQMRMRGATNAGTYYFDEIRIGTTVGDVVLVPEPGAVSLALGGLAVIGLVGRRRAGGSPAAVR